MTCEQVYRLTELSRGNGGESESDQGEELHFDGSIILYRRVCMLSYE